MVASPLKNGVQKATLGTSRNCMSNTIFIEDISNFLARKFRGPFAYLRGTDKEARDEDDVPVRFA